LIWSRVCGGIYACYVDVVRAAAVARRAATSAVEALEWLVSSLSAVFGGVHLGEHLQLLK